MAIRKIVSRSIGVDVIAAEDFGGELCDTAEIQDGVITQAKLAFTGVGAGGGSYQGDNNSAPEQVLRQTSLEFTNNN